MSKTNPLRKFLSKEDVFQEACVQWLGYQYKDLFWMHVPNEGKRSPFEQVKFKALGGKAGVSDIIIMDPSGDGIHKGFVIELKCGANACSDAQVDFLISSHKKGFAAAVVYDDVELFIKLINRYLSPKGSMLFYEILVCKHDGKLNLKMLDYAEAKTELVKSKKSPLVKKKLFTELNHLKIKP